MRYFCKIEIDFGIELAVTFDYYEKDEEPQIDIIELSICIEGQEFEIDYQNKRHPERVKISAKRIKQLLLDQYEIYPHSWINLSGDTEPVLYYVNERGERIDR
tara:strand:+ start:609 stop:917 length:309 start_codon:yes stop_codon:yes gene_type:complete